MSRRKYFWVAALFPLVFSVAFAEEFRYDSHGKRDPFLISKGANVTLDDTGSKVDLKLEGVVLDPKGRSVAVVNGEMVWEGDQIGGSVTVKKITIQGVEFESEGKSFTIPIVAEDE